MSRKGLFFAVAAVLAAFSASAPANAGPDAGIVNVDYDAGGYYGAYGPAYGNGLLDLPAAVIGGAFGLLTGAFGGAFDGGPYAADPFYAGQYYGDQGYSNGYNNNGNYGNGYYGNGYYDNGYGNGYDGGGYYGGR